jgi:hypothetical protein
VASKVPTNSPQFGEDLPEDVDETDSPIVTHMVFFVLPLECFILRLLIPQDLQVITNPLLSANIISAINHSV